MKYLVAVIRYYALAVALWMPRVLPHRFAAWLLVKMFGYASHSSWRQFGAFELCWNRGNPGIASAAYDGAFVNLRVAGSQNPIEVYVERCAHMQIVPFSEYEDHERKENEQLEKL